MASRNRGYFNCTPLEGVWWSLHKDQVAALANHIQPLALLYRESYHIPDGILVMSGSGMLMHYQGGAVRSIDQRKARAALDWMETRKREREAQIARGEEPEPYIPKRNRKVEDDAADEAGG